MALRQSNSSACGKEIPGPVKIKSLSLWKSKSYPGENYIRSPVKIKFLALGK
jgi:hypothetical protein